MRADSGSFSHGTSMGMRRRRQKSRSSSRSHVVLFPLQGRSAPPASVFDVSGTTLSQSMPSVRPKPRHVGHAPTGDW